MKRFPPTYPHPICPPRQSAVFDRLRLPRRGAGIALVIVLSFLVLITVLAIAFFSSVTTELTSAKSYADGTTVRQLSDSAVQLVTGAIRDATYRADSDLTPAPISSGIAAWASQPGMIRTYSSVGNPLAFYKLYSSNNMVVRQSDIGGFTYQNNDLKVNGGDIKAWVNQPAIFTDLNAPKRDVYPILNPAAADPALNPWVTSTGNNYVPSFKIDASSTSPVSTTGDKPNPAPMPVKWIYMLQDGTTTTPDTVDGTGKIAQWTGITAFNQPSVTNPIVGRMAFWTDDESCKVNLNTASEGAFWDTPRNYNTYEYVNLANNQPAQKEFQRYPGHPATTSLSAVLKNLSDPEAVYNMVPRTATGGSQGGTMPVTPSSPPLVPSLRRLFSSVDEFIFDPARALQFEDLNKTRPLTRDELEPTRFFLTASSRAPDLNLFGKPRVSMWPITLDKADPSVQLTTTFDQLISFCTTVGHSNNGTPSSFYFQRQDPNSATNDLPGASADTGLGRNRKLLAYLRDLTGRKVPGFSGLGTNPTFAKKYPYDLDQILTEMFDYVRCTNLRDTTLGTAWAGQYTKAFTNPGFYEGLGQVVPILDQTVTPNTRGFGRFPTLEQFSLLFIATKDSTTNPTDSGTNPVIPKVSPGKIRVQAAAFPQLFDPSMGLVLTSPWYTLKIIGLDTLQWNDQSMGFPANVVLPRPRAENFSGRTFYGGAMDFRQSYVYQATGFKLISAETGSASTPDFPDATQNPNGTFKFSGGNITVEIHGLDAGGNLGPTLQSIALNLPPMPRCPVPKLGPDVLQVGTAPNPVISSGSFRSIQGRLGSNPRFPIITNNDVVRSVVATPGDIRLIAARQTISLTDSDPLFRPHIYYLSEVQNGTKFAHNLYIGKGLPFYGATGGKLVDLVYPGYQSQYLTNGNGWDIANGGTVAIDTNVPSNTSVTVSGSPAADWDNGVANVKDGPYINKADEGDGNSDSYNSGTNNAGGYFGIEYTGTQTAPGGTFFSPNRLIPSPVMFGSLPTGVYGDKPQNGVYPTKPWQTLLFRAGPTGHKGLGFPTGGPAYTDLPDHLFLDLFHMPVVEPYAISEPLSTAGRINMNYQLAPFSYITRDSGIRAVLKAEKMLAVPDGRSGTYKTTGNPQVQPNAVANNRQDINLDATLAQFQARFNSPKNDLFRSASEICSIDLVPKDYTGVLPVTRASMDLYWNGTSSASKDGHQLTGDNSREKPYADIYPRLTTKSNTYTVHMCVQTLRQLPVGRAVAADWKTWNEGRDPVTSEYRGSQLIERYVDPSDPALPDFADSANFNLPFSSTSRKNLDAYYKFRVVSAKQFAP